MPSGGSRASRSDRLKYDIVADLKEGSLSQQAIAAAHKVSQAFVSKVKDRMFVYGQPSAPPHSKRGRPRKVTAEFEAAILDFLEEHPAPLIDEVQDLIRDKFDVEIGRSAVCAALKRCKLARKRGTAVNPNQDPLLRENLVVARAEYTSDQG